MGKAAIIQLHQWKKEKGNNLLGGESRRNLLKVESPVPVVDWGGFSYHDFSGHKGTINTGDVQWMTAWCTRRPWRPKGHQPLLQGLTFFFLLHPFATCSPACLISSAAAMAGGADSPCRAMMLAGWSRGTRSWRATTSPPRSTSQGDRRRGPGRARACSSLQTWTSPCGQARLPVPPGWSAYFTDGEAVFGDGDARPHGEAVVKNGPFVMNRTPGRRRMWSRPGTGRLPEPRRNGFEMELRPARGGPLTLTGDGEAGDQRIPVADE
uniref:Uncharacterized protein n=1 Tax=Oryza punctata TaxID=4537 RepID=A0A0E0LSA3_ORYPU